jgi:ABC-type multidrug transport system ATPase subunit
MCISHAVLRRKLYHHVCRMQVLLNGITKSYAQGYGLPPVAAIAGLWLRVWPGECFGLLGVNGAGGACS